MRSSSIRSLRFESRPKRFKASIRFSDSVQPSPSSPPVLPTTHLRSSTTDSKTQPPDSLKTSLSSLIRPNCHLQPSLPSAFHPALLQLAFTSKQISDQQLNYLKQLSNLLFSEHPPHLLPPISDLLAHLRTHDLFQFLSPAAFRALLAAPHLDHHQSHFARQHAVHERTFFILDRIYELEHRFSQDQLDTLHTIALRQYAAVGFWRGAELVWDHLVRAGGRRSDRLFVVECIRQALLQHRSLRSASQQPLPTSLEYTAPTIMELRRMVDLAEELGERLIESDELDGPTTRWVVRAVAQILGTQRRVKALGGWLSRHCGIDIEVPDTGASWTDPTITATVVDMYRQEGQLGWMVAAYHAAAEPSVRMRADPATAVQPEGQGCGPQTNPILTRTFHDLIDASCDANRPHLAIHFLTQAVERTEAYVNALPAPDAFPPPPALRLQPATFAELVRMLRRRKRNTQLASVAKLTERLLEATVAELDWIRQLAEIHGGGPDGERWEGLLRSIVPLTSTSDHKPQHEALERLVFSNRFSRAVPELDFLRLQERTHFLSRSLAHTIRLRNRLEGLIGRCEVSREIRFEVGLLKRKARRKTDRVEKLLDRREAEQKLRGAFRGDGEVRKKVLSRLIKG